MFLPCRTDLGKELSPQKRQSGEQEPLIPRLQFFSSLHYAATLFPILFSL
jgi:hypothetical protein